MFLDICGIPGVAGCLHTGQKVAAAPAQFAACSGAAWAPISERTGGADVELREGAQFFHGRDPLPGPTDQRPLPSLLLAILLTFWTLLQVVDGHYPHVMPHASNLSFWEKGMTSDIGSTFLIGTLLPQLRMHATLPRPSV